MSTGGTRRQLTPAQQTHILSDIQQHQHRFASQPQSQLFNPNVNKNFGKSSVVVEPSINAQLPTETTVYQLNPQQQSFVPIQSSISQPQSQQLTSHRFRQPASGVHAQHHTQTNFVPNFNSPPNHITFPQQPLFERPNAPSFVQQPPQQSGPTVFQRSTASQQGDHSFKPSQPFPATQQTFEQFSQNSFNKQAPIQTLQNQIFQTPFNQNQAPPQTPTHSLAPPAVNQFAQFKFNPQPPQIQQQQYLQEEARLKDLIERQKIIQKHEQFVQRQYQKQQQKVRQMHEEFVQRQRRIKEQSIANSNPRSSYFPQNPKARVVSQYDSAAFEKALETYHVAPTTQSPTTIAEASSLVSRVKASRANSKGDLSEDELEKLLTSHREKILNHLRQQESSDKPAKKAKGKPTKAIGREDLLQQLKLALADQPADLGGKNYTAMDLVLPDGQKVQVIRTTDPNLVHGATPLSEDGQFLSQISAQQLVREQPQEQKPLQEQIADSSILPPGSNYEVIKQTEDGNLQSVSSLPDQKKVTFVYLEEQDDGSFKVQGVKANGEKEAKTKGVEVDSIIDRIKKGEIQLPPSANDQAQGSASPGTRATAATAAPSSTADFSQSTRFESSSPTTRFSPSATPSPPAHYVSTVSPSVQFVSTASPYSTLNTVASDSTFRLTASPSTHFASTTPRSTPSRSAQTTRGISTSFPHTASTAHARPSTTASQQSSASTLSHVHTTPTQSSQGDLSTILKNNGLHAMAKYLKQSGLDSILNETGPYTVFAPSDKAFKTLLVQLGGPDRADEKFKANPRLLSGVSIALSH